MKRLSLYVFLVLMWCNTVQALSTCKGENIRKLTKPFKWHNCLGVEQIEGDKYEGEYKFGKFSGHGTYTWSNGSTYVGGWSSGRMHGYGIYRSADGKTSYEGEFKNDARDGIGIEKSASGKISGVIYKNGRLVKQEFKIDIPDGEGTHIYPDGSKYVGNFQDGFKHGKGTLTWDGNNGKYVGDFKNGFWHGKGTYAVYRADSHLPYLYYDGEWKYGKRHGNGTEEYSDGSKHVGIFINDVPEGDGTFIFPDGSRCKGYWRDGWVYLSTSQKKKADRINKKIKNLEFKLKQDGKGTSTFIEKKGLEVNGEKDISEEDLAKIKEEIEKEIKILKNELPVLSDKCKKFVKK